MEREYSKAEALNLGFPLLCFVLPAPGGSCATSCLPEASCLAAFHSVEKWIAPLIGAIIISALSAQVQEVMVIGRMTKILPTKCRGSLGEVSTNSKADR